MMTSKCRWQPVDQPVVPTEADDLALLDDAAPSVTRNFDWWP